MDAGRSLRFHHVQFYVDSLQVCVGGGPSWAAPSCECSDNRDRSVRHAMLSEKIGKE
eukprot:SAG11_NODE_354_length_10336_cov_3.789391_15_plen_57_part_00